MREQAILSSLQHRALFLCIAPREKQLKPPAMPTGSLTWHPEQVQR